MLVFHIPSCAFVSGARIFPFDISIHTTDRLQFCGPGFFYLKKYNKFSVFWIFFINIFLSYIMHFNQTFFKYFGSFQHQSIIILPVLIRKDAFIALAKGNYFDAVYIIFWKFNGKVLYWSREWVQRIYKLHKLTSRASWFAKWPPSQSVPVDLYPICLLCKSINILFSSFIS